MNRTLSTLVLAAAALLLLPACQKAKPQTQVPAPPTIESFTASKSEGAVGDSVTLSWKVTGADAIDLREVSTGALEVEATLLEGTKAVTLAGDALFLLTARGAGGTDARALAVRVTPGAGPAVLRAVPPTIFGAQSTTLVWSVPRAQAVRISDGAADLDLAGQVEVGAVVVTPAQSTTYTLTSGALTASAAVTVRPRVLAFTASSGVVESGQAVTLAWKTAGAAKVTLKSDGRGVLATETAAGKVADGSFSDTPPGTVANTVVRYTLEVEQGAEVLTQGLEVLVGSTLDLTTFEAAALARSAASFPVAWTTLAASSVRVVVDGAVVHTTSTSAEAASGRFSFSAPAHDFTLDVIAVGAGGHEVRRTRQVDVVGAPTQVTVTAAPATPAAGDAVTLTWSSPEARRVRITDSTGLMVFSTGGVAAEGGTVTVYPNADTTWTATAENGLGDAPVTGTASVTLSGAPATLAATPRTVVSGAPVQLAWTDPTAPLFGAPHSQVLTSTQSNFIDIKATGTRLSIVLDADEVVRFDPGFTTWLWGEKKTGLVTVSRAGWMAWGVPAVVSSTSYALPSTSAPRNVLAPFWANLTRTPTSGVYWQVVGEAPEQVLVVQWDALQVTTNVGKTVTFQAQVHQTGQVTFSYKEMLLPAGFTSFSVGAQDGTAERAVAVSGTPATETATYLFSPVASPLTVTAVRGKPWSAFVRRGASWLPLQGQLSAVLLPHDLGLTEAMYAPASSPDAGEWVELTNRTGGALDLAGWRLESGGGRFMLPSPFVVPAGGSVLVGQSTLAEDNDDAGVAVSWGSALSLADDAGSVALVAANDAGISLAWTGLTDGGRGVAQVADLGAYVFAGSDTQRAESCRATTVYGGAAQLATPGAASGCSFPYAVQSIPESFLDITDGGTSLVNTPTSATDGKTVAVTLAATTSDPAPTHFGARQAVFSVSSDGWMVPGSTTTTSYSNKTSPTTSTPVGTLAPFWDDLHTTPNLPAQSDVYWKRVAAGEDPRNPGAHWVFQWAHLRHYGTSPADDLNFEVKYFDTGVIEYHYGDMVSGTTNSYADGNSATVWLENPAGTQALAISINKPWVRAHSAIRFTPR